MKYVISFKDPLACKIELSGGKGANLALLTQRGFPVPPGFTVTARTYRDFIQARGELLREVDTMAFDDPGRLRGQSEQLRRGLAELPLPSEAVSEVRQQLASFDPGQPFSVRSSSTMEDLASAAFAGQHETYLNCIGEDLILRRVRDCFLSLWFDRAIAYRHQQGFDHALASMAVVVQQMVQCDVAGVGFSINPVNGSLTEMIIDANFGLGESVVSGQAEVDHFVLDKASHAVLCANIARKTQKVVSVARDIALSSGTKEVALTAEEATQPCLSPAQLEKLATLLLNVENSYRFPQDIEWGFVGSEVYLLQSRPITTIPPRWTRDESAERFPNVITPLTWDFVETGFHRSLNYSFRLMGFPPFNGKWFGMHGHYIYGNQNAVELYGRRVPFVARNLDELRAIIPKLREDYRWVQELPGAWSRDLDYYLISIGQFMSEPLASKSLRQVWQFVLQINERGAEYFLPNIAISITQSTLYRLLHYLLKSAFAAEADDLFDRLMAYCETRTGVINKELYELAAMVRNQPALQEVFASNPSRVIVEQSLLKPFPEFGQRVQKFLRDHGHREVDFDAYCPTWSETPWVVLDNVRLILQTPMDQTPAAKERDLKIRMQEAELTLARLLPADLQFFFAEIVRLARAYTSLDDLEHYQTTRLTPALRRGLRELGNRLVQKGVLAQPMDIFFGHMDQIERATLRDDAEGWDDFKNAVRLQKESYLQNKARTPEWKLGEAQETKSTGDFLTGLPGSPGRAEGPVFLVLAPDDFSKFPKGSVLVTRTTNPTWTPLFYSAIAVVTESGGPLSHGAVTAREMKLPAVMSVRDVLSVLKNGQHVRVDGTQGKVYLVI